MDHATLAGSGPAMLKIDDLRHFAKKATEDAATLIHIVFETLLEAVPLASAPREDVGDEGSLVARLSNMIEILREIDAHIETFTVRNGLTEISEADYD